MDQEQLEEYRKRMQAKYQRQNSSQDEEIARKIQEEEKRRAAEQAKRDEEIARKLQSQYEGGQSYQPGTYQEPQPAGHSPPGYNPSTPAYNPAPAYNPPPAYQPSSRRPPPRQEQQPLLASEPSQGCLPQVTDKCCGVNTQYCVLGVAGVMTLGILISIIILAAT